MTKKTRSREEPSEEGIVAEVSGLGREYGKLVSEEDREKSARYGLVNAIARAQKELGKPIDLPRTSLGKHFPRISSARIEGASIVFVPEQKRKAVSYPLARLEFGLFMELAKEAAERIEAMGEEKQLSRIEEIRPKLSLSLKKEVGRLSVLERQGFRLLVMNSGGDAKDLYVLSKSEGKQRRYGPFLARRAKKAEVGALLPSPGVDAMLFEVNCRDTDERLYSGSIEMPLDERSWKKLELARLAAPE